MKAFRMYWREALIAAWLVGMVAYLAWGHYESKAELDSVPSVVVTDGSTEPYEECVWEISPDQDDWTLDVTCSFE